jgi:RNA polymerase sigma-70 factor (ECF subfamily)
MTQYVNLQEETILAGCLKNDRRAQEQLYRLYADEMYTVCLAYEKDRDAVKDILQESFIKVFRSIEKYDKKGPLKAWVRRIVVNTAIDHFRNKKDVDAFVEVEAIAETTPGQTERQNGHGVKDILKMVMRLPEGARMVFNLFALEGYSHKEIADRLSITEGTSKSQYSRARHLLRQWIER